MVVLPTIDPPLSRRGGTGCRLRDPSPASHPWRATSSLGWLRARPNNLRARRLRSC